MNREMADKSSGNKPSSGAIWPNKPVPMKLFGGWEVDKTPSNCIPRLCSLNITRLVLCKPLGPDVTTFMIAVKMQSSKRTLRSNEISVPNVNDTNTGAVELDLTFSLQYPHFLKRSGNQLQIMVQRRKRYKNRAILGFKTLAFGIINMAEVLQRSSNIEKELELMTNIKELGKNEVIARILVSSLKSLPVDQENSANGRHMKVTLDRSADVDSEDEEFSSNEEGSDSETVEEPTAGTHNTNLSTRDRLNQWRRQVNTRKTRKLFPNRDNTGSDPNAQRNDRNFKQKFIALLKKFRLPDSEGFDTEEQYQEALEQQLMASGQLQRSRDIDDFFEEEDIDDLSDSGQDFDDVSISSTPKPSLRPYFSSCTLVGPEAESLNGERKKRIEYDSQENSGPEQTPDTSDNSLKHTPNEEPTHKKQIGSIEKEKKSKLFQRDKQNASKDRKVSASNMIVNTSSAPFIKERSMSCTKDVESSPRKSVLDQLSRIFSSDESSIPDQFMLINAGDGSFGQILAQLLERQHLVVSAHNSADIKASFASLSAKIQKFCNCNSRAPSPIKVAVLGNDAFINSVLRHYVETFSSKPPDWQNYLRFHIIPVNNMYSQFVKYLGSVDTIYGNNFCNGSWKELFDEHSSSLSLTQEVIHRIVNYMNGANHTFQVPIAEAMVTYKERSLDDESLQVFIPFICDVKIGVMETITNHSLDDENQILSSSPPTTSQTNPYVGSIEKSISLTSPLSSKDQQFSSTTITPPSSPSISGSLIGAQNATNALLTGAQIQLNQTLQSQPLQTANSQSSPQQTTADNRNLNSSLSISSNETMDLQIDYWPIPLKSSDVTNKKAESSKFTLKNTFRTLQISRLPNIGELTSQSLTLSYITKEKKQKIVMRLGKKKEKERDPENKCQTAEGIHRLVCSCKTSQNPLKVIIDGVEWSGVKFFQLTAQWQTQIKYFPVALFSPVQQMTDPNSRITNRINVCNSLTA